MLILSRNPGQQIRIADDIVVRVLEINGKQVKIGIDAPKTVSVDREEIYQRKKASALRDSFSDDDSIAEKPAEEQFIA